MQQICSHTGQPGIDLQLAVMDGVVSRALQPVGWGNYA
jgi:hypothetical protein